MDEITIDYNNLLFEIKSSYHFKNKSESEKKQALDFINSEVYLEMFRISWNKLHGLEAFFGQAVPVSEINTAPNHVVSAA